MNLKKILYLAGGFVGLGLGALGAVLPLLPAFPFLLLAAFCFGKSSEQLDRWFCSTRLYKNNLESYVAGRGMTLRTKVRIMVEGADQEQIAAIAQELADIMKERL